MAAVRSVYVCVHVVESIQNRRSDTNNLISATITLSNTANVHVENIRIYTINCHLICNKCDGVSAVVKDVDLDVLIITDT